MLSFTLGQGVSPILSFVSLCPCSCLVYVCNLAWGEARFDSWAMFGDVVVPLLGWHELALHLAFACPPHKIKNLPDAGVWPEAVPFWCAISCPSAW